MPEILLFCSIYTTTMYSGHLREIEREAHEQNREGVITSKGGAVKCYNADGS